MYAWRGAVYDEVQALGSVYSGAAFRHDLLPKVLAAEDGSPLTQASQDAVAAQPSRHPPPLSPSIRPAARGHFRHASSVSEWAGARPLKSFEGAGDFHRPWEHLDSQSGQ